MSVSEPVEKALKSLEGLLHDHLDVGGYMLSADREALFTVDMMAQAVLHRSMGLVRSFSDAIRSENFLCAAPLVRLQLDNLLRFYALSIVAEPHRAAFQVFTGTPLRNQTDRDGKKMTDRYLVGRLSAELPWVADVYRETSGFIHLSEKHIYSTQGDTDEANRTVNSCISGRDYCLTDASRIEAIECMIETTKQVLRYVYSWARTKDIVGASRPSKADGEPSQRAPASNTDAHRTDPDQ